MKKLLFLSSLVWSSIFAYPNMIVEHYTVERGMPNNIVNYSFKGKDGLIWFGTWYGLCSFDGVNFKTYNHRSNIYTAIPPQKIQRIVEDKNGYLWIKTIDRKLYSFDKKHECFYPVYDVLKEYTENTQIVKLESTPEGDILFVTMNGTLMRAYTAENGKVHILKLYEAPKEICKNNSNLKHNILCESTDYINWISSNKLQIYSFKKGEQLRGKKPGFINQQLPATSLSQLTCISAAGQHLCLGDQQGSVFFISLQTGVVTHHKIPEIDTPIRNILANSSGTLHISTDSHLYEYCIENKQLKRLSLPVQSKNIVRSFIDKYDKIWFMEANRAIIYYDPTNEYSRRFEYEAGPKVGDFEVQDIGEHGLFFLTSTGEILLFNRELLSMTPLNSIKPFDEGYSNQLFNNLLLDDCGVLWIASTTNGVYRINFPKKQFQQLRNLPPPPASFNMTDIRNIGVRSLCQTRNGDIWVGTRWQDVILFDRNAQVKEVFSKSELFAGAIYHIMEDSKGTLWFSTKGNGLVQAEPNPGAPHGLQFTRYVNKESDPTSLSSNDVYFTFEDSQQRIWVATLSGGLNLMYKEEGINHFKHKNNGLTSYPHYGLYTEIRALVEDKEGRIWVGTMDGLMSFDSHFKATEQIEFETYRKRTDNSSITVNDIHLLYKDKESQIWLSVFGGGISKLLYYDKKERRPLFQSYDIPGIVNDVVMSMSEDNEGNLWLATENGVSSFNKKKEFFRSYNKYDGFPNVKPEENSILLTHDGEFWLGCNKEIIVFSPKKLKTDNIPYPIYIVGFNVSKGMDGGSLQDSTHLAESIKYAKAIQLKHFQSMFTIEFSALNYHNPGQISYRYILHGYEEEWHYNRDNRFASYIHVPPGDYVFCVEALDESGIRPIASKSLSISILAPWWQSKWAYAFYTLFSLGLITISMKFILFYLRTKNNLYIEQQLTEMRIKFFTNISHELRTPLTLIRIPIQELKLRERFTGKSLIYLNMIEKSSSQMLQLVNQILDFRKVQSGKMILRISPISLHHLMELFYQEFHVLAEENNITFTVQLPNKQDIIWADQEKLSIAIRNIVGNAFKFTPEGGSIFISTAFLEAKNRYIIEVKDNGIGISPDKLTDIFDLFIQDSPPTNASYLGSGIGLALSKEIIKLHQGEIRVESVVQQGAIFTIELISGKEHFISSEVIFCTDELSHIEEKSSLHGERIAREEMSASAFTLLLIEDNKKLRNLIKLQLEEKYNVILAENGVEGLRKTHLYRPDIIISDQMMPGMDGLELLKRIREEETLSHIPVIILTAKYDETNKIAATALGANSYITKPFNKEYLLARIDQLLNERRLVHDNALRQLETHVQEKKSEEKQVSASDKKLLEDTYQIIAENISNCDFNIEAISGCIGLSRSTFFKKIKRLTGLPPIDLVKEIRLTRSLELLKKSNKNIAEIASTIGFKDPNYFSKCFRKKFNITPREYIHQERK